MASRRRDRAMNAPRHSAVADVLLYRMPKQQRIADGRKPMIKIADHLSAMLVSRLSIAAAISGCALVIAVAPTVAQNFPDKPIRIIVAAAAGGPSDFPARLAAQIL